MSEPSKDGGPAFPSVTRESVFVDELGRYDDRWGPPMGGMSRRDFFAAHAFGMGEIVHGFAYEIAMARGASKPEPRDYASAAYSIADAMLAKSET